jgi:mannan endo-1,4-beta-mannosidase
VQRAPAAAGPWQTVGLNISDAARPYMPLFGDGTARPGRSYYYRVTAENESGRSAPSNVVGPVAVRTLTFVDDMRSLTRGYRASGQLAVATDDDRRFKEALQRVRGEEGAELVYATPGVIAGLRVLAFAQDTSPALSFALSDDGVTFRDAAVEGRSFVTAAGAYGYWQPILYQAAWTGGQARYIRIRFERSAQISRVEVRYGAAR